MNDTNETKTDGCTTQGANVAPEASQSPCRATCVACGEHPARIAATHECLDCYAHATFHGGDCETIDAVDDFIDDVLLSNGAEALDRDERLAIAEIGRSYGFTFSDQWK